MSDAGLADAFVRGHRRCETKRDPLEDEGRVADLLMAVLERHAIVATSRMDRSPPAPAIERAMEYIQDCYALPITLDGVAEAAGLSRYAVLRAFRREVGIAPYSFVTQVRIEQAKRLLRAGVGIADVSQRIGFSDQSHLTRHFKRLVGVTHPAGTWSLNDIDMYDAKGNRKPVQASTMNAMHWLRRRGGERARALRRVHAVG